MDLEPNDGTCLETVHSDGLISQDLGYRTSAAFTPACNHPTRNNESLDLLMPSRGRLHTFFDFRFASLYRSLYAVTIRPKALYEDVHASTGHPGYAGMQWHQKNTTGANYTDKDAAAPRGICQGCALGGAHQYPTNQHYVMSDTPHDPRSTVRSQHLYTSQRWSQRLCLCSSVHGPCLQTGVPRIHQVKTSLRADNQHVRTLLWTP